MITDYASLKASIANWLARADLTAAIPEFIQLAEGRINRTLFIRERMTQATGTTSGGEIAVPGDLDRIVSLRVLRGSDMVAVNPVPPDAIKGRPGSPTAYTVTGSSLVLDGSDDTDYSLLYYARIPGLSDTNSQNWLLLKEPSLYLYGALMEAAPYLRNDDRTALWASQFKAALDDLSMTDEMARYGNAPAARVSFNAP